MNIITFFKDNNLDPQIELREGKNCYQDSDTPIQYIRLDKELKTGQDHLVLSRSLAEEITAGKLTLKDAQVQFNGESYGLIRPDSSKVIATVKLW